MPPAARGPRPPPSGAAGPGVLAKSTAGLTVVRTRPARLPLEHDTRTIPPGSLGKISNSKMGAARMDHALPPGVAGRPATCAEIYPGSLDGKNMMTAAPNARRDGRGVAVEGTHDDALGRDGEPFADQLVRALPEAATDHR